MANVVRPFKGVSAAERTAQRRADLLEAGLDEVAAVGITGLRMSSVCERAGLTQRYFYEHFGNRDELLVALFGEMIDDMLARTVVAVEAQPLDLLARARMAVDVFLDSFVDEPRRARLYSEAESMPELAARKTEGIRGYVEYAITQVESVYGRLEEPARTRTGLAAAMVVTGQAATSLAWHHGQIPLSRADYVDTVAHVFVEALMSVRNL